MPEIPAPMINTSKYSAAGPCCSHERSSEAVMSHTIGMQPRTEQELTGAVTETKTDAVIVGAGFAGLAAARELVQLGHTVLVLEGRDRVGGRSCTTSIAGVSVDLGATFVGPNHDEILKVAADLGCQNVPTYTRGR